jgi:site-specific DNA-methyltransferase (adenine-specific)
MIQDAHIHQGDCLEIMKTFDDEIIDLTVTSPPYDNLRTYKGFTFNFEGIAPCFRPGIRRFGAHAHGQLTF